jgi:hypothetical protein
MYVKQTTFCLQRDDGDNAGQRQGSRNIPRERVRSCTWPETLKLGVLRTRGAKRAAAPGGKIGRKINIWNEKKMFYVLKTLYVIGPNKWKIDKVLWLYFMVIMSLRGGHCDSWPPESQKPNSATACLYSYFTGGQKSLFRSDCRPWNLTMKTALLTNCSFTLNTSRQAVYI